MKSISLFSLQTLFFLTCLCMYGWLIYSEECILKGQKTWSSTYMVWCKCNVCKKYENLKKETFSVFGFSYLNVDLQSRFLLISTTSCLIVYLHVFRCTWLMCKRYMVEEVGHWVSSCHLIWNPWWVEHTFHLMINTEDQGLKLCLGK